VGALLAIRPDGTGRRTLAPLHGELLTLDWAR
jgi:hypothetical protein